MSSVLRRNVTANFAGQIWNALLRLAFVPVYFHLLGAEAYGLVGFFTAIEAISMVLDMSLSTTATREIARRLDDPEGAGECRSLIRTLEVIYWAAGLLIGLALLLATLLWLDGEGEPLAPLAAVALSVVVTRALVVNSDTFPPPDAFQAVFAAMHRTVSPRERCRKTT